MHYRSPVGPPCGRPSVRCGWGFTVAHRVSSYRKALPVFCGGLPQIRDGAGSADESIPREASRAGALAHKSTIRSACRESLRRQSIPRSEERRVGKSVSVRVDLGGRRIIKKKKRTTREISRIQLSITPTIYQYKSTSNK